MEADDGGNAGDGLPPGDLEARVNATADTNPRARELVEKYRVDLELIYILRWAAAGPRTGQEPHVEGPGRSQ
ncbi:hypothetical protein AB0D08_34660 [Kitasatospora sp. NPDC048540]|uniref:hypothetical protein n=1 Tax=Kitasatospora sp. NPDC048540 TaxID=3155634 RepID=UPI0033F7B0DD